MDSLKWWQKAVFYQIYPRSFADGTGDGIGDFPGMTAKLGYLRDLGIDAIWLSPHYPSPFLDCGYDVSDYTDVGPEYGTLDDFKAFLDAAHKHHIRVILDLVLNHSSDLHPWFIESKSSRDNPKRDWYVWHDPAPEGGPPNNWNSIFGGSAWEWNEATQQYYYHAFLKEQPDLNWRNEEVKQAMWNVVRFWLDMGVDGFRLDAVTCMLEHPDMPNHTATMTSDQLSAFAAVARTDAEREMSHEQYRLLLQYQSMQPGIHELMRELRAVVDEYPGDRVLVGEDEDFAFHGEASDELHLVFNFPMLRVNRLTPDHVRANQTLRLGEIPAGEWPCNTLGNHDTSRMYSRYGDGIHDEALARLHLALILLLKGTPFLYNGEEIGMTDLLLTDLSQFRDTIALSHYRMMTEQLGLSAEDALQRVAGTTRDRCRTPLQWSDAPNAGFSPPNVETWLPVNPNYKTGVNVESQENDPDSILSFYRRILHARRTSPALVAGDYTVLQPSSTDYLAFLRHYSEQTCLVVLNFSETGQTISLDDAEVAGKQARMLFSRHKREDEPLALNNLALAPFEIAVLELT